MRFLFLTAICFLVFVPHSLMGQAVFNNQISPDTAYWSDDTSIFQEVLDNFSLSGPTTITGVEFSGVYGNSVSANDNFAIDFYMDNGGLPAFTPFVTTQLTNVQRTATGITIVGGFDLYTYVADVGPVTLNANNPMWIRIYNDTNGEFWNWGALSTGNNTRVGGLYYQNDNNPAWTPFGGDMDFRLFGATAIPEPSSIIGLLGLSMILTLSPRNRMV